MKIRSRQDWTINPFTDMETNNEPSLTNQDDAITIDEILERFTRGTWHNPDKVLQDAAIQDDEDFENEIDLEKFSRLDPAERHEVILGMNNEIHNFAQRRAKEAKDLAKYEAAKKAREDREIREEMARIAKEKKLRIQAKNALSGKKPKSGDRGQ